MDTPPKVGGGAEARSGSVFSSPGKTHLPVDLSKYASRLFPVFSLASVTSLPYNNPIKPLRALEKRPLPSPL